MSQYSSDDEVGIDDIPEIHTQSNRRGPTTMVHLAQIRTDADRLVVEYNAQGEWIGNNATTMVSYIGMCVRNYIPITYDSWIHVPRELKDKIYSCIEVSLYLI